MRARVPVSVGLCLVLAACFTSTAEDGGTSECLNQADGVDCSVGLCCGQVCAQFMTDPNNCGTCGFACPNEETCANGVCIDCSRLPDGTSCNGFGYKGQCCSGACVNPRNDHNNCGGCGENGDAGGSTVCTIGQNCVDAGCVAECIGAADNSMCSVLTPGDGNCCGQICTNPETDPNNCYLCGFACPTGKCENAECTCNGNGDCKSPTKCNMGFCN